MEASSPPEEAAPPVEVRARRGPPPAGAPVLEATPRQGKEVAGATHLPRKGFKPGPDGAGIATPGGAHRPPGLLRSVGFRFALLFAALFATAALALVGTLWLVTAGTLDRQTDMAIRADALALVERFREGGTANLVEAIEERLAVDVENDGIYLLVTADTDRRLAGNLNRWPLAWHPTENWFRTRVVHDGAETEARLYKIELPEMRLLVGRDRKSTR